MNEYEDEIEEEWDLIPLPATKPCPVCSWPIETNETICAECLDERALD
jgi:hypothetical protein